MKKRSKSLASQVNSIIGSMTHWMFRGIISFVSEKFGIRLSTGVERILAYILAGLFLALIGVWHYLPWLPGIQFPSFNTDMTTLLAIAGIVLSYLGWRAAREASMYAKQAVEDSRVARLTVRHTPEYGGFTISNIGKDMAKNIHETSGCFNSVPTELLASIVPPTYDPRQAINRSAITLIQLVRPVGPMQEITATFEYENLFGEKFISHFTLMNLQNPSAALSYAPYKVSEKSWLSH
jgi:hypothetical protein